MNTLFEQYMQLDIDASWIGLEKRDHPLYSCTPMDDPYDYVIQLQKEFDHTKIRYCDEFYEQTGWEKPAENEI